MIGDPDAFFTSHPQLALELARQLAGRLQRILAYLADIRDYDLFYFDDSDLSWAANHTALLGTYTQAQARTAMLLGEATEVFTALSTTLDQIATAYEAGDERAAADLKGVWDVRE